MITQTIYISIFNMISNIINTNKHIQTILNTFSKYGLSSENLEIVPSILTWAKERNIPIKSDPIGFSVHEVNHETNEKKKIIVLSEKINQNEIKSVISRINYPKKKPTDQLNDDKSFIQHLVLHEIGHIVNGITQANENLADDFAFNEMRLVLVEEK